MFISSTFYAQNPLLEIVDRQEERECISTHTRTKRMFSRTNPLCATSCVTNNISPRFSPTILYRDANSVLLREPCVLKCSLGESEGLSTHRVYNGNIQQNPLCVESCVTISHLSPFLACVFHRDAISLLLRAHLCTAVDSMRKNPCVRKCSSREREGLYNGQGQRAQFHLSAEPKL